MNARTGWIVAAGILVFSLHVARGAEPPAETATWVVPVTLGIQAGENEVYGLGDVLVPLLRHDRGLLFLNPRATASDRSQEEVNLGLGYRHLFEGRVPFILGANAYYDTRWTRHHNRYDQLGLGLELLSEWVDARANYYIPEHNTVLIESRQTESVETRQRTSRHSEIIQWYDPYAQAHQIRQDYLTRHTTRRTTVRDTLTQVFERHEAALEGWDAEMGLRLPLPALPIQTRVFAGYQYFLHPFGDSLKGWKGRVEVRALDGRLSLDAQVFENRELNGRTDYLVGARLRLPFEAAALAQGRNPFATARDAVPRGLRERLDEMVMRDPKIQTRESAFVENEDLRHRDTQTRTRTRTREETDAIVLLDDILFVDGEGGDDANPGTAEAPKASIAHAAGQVFGDRNIYVHSTSAPYIESVVLLPHTRLIGSGVGILGQDGRLFGGHQNPTVVGTDAPTIQMAPHTTVAGFEIMHMNGGDGISANTGEHLRIIGNRIHGNDRGIHISSPFDADVTITLAGNLISGNPGGGAFLFGLSLDAEHSFQVTARHNTFGVGLYGLRINAYGYGDIDVTVDDLEVTGTQIGLWLDLDSAHRTFVQLTDIQSTHNANTGATLTLASGGSSLLWMGSSDPAAPSRFSDNGFGGLNLTVTAEQLAAVWMQGVEAHRIGFGNGIQLTVTSHGGNAIVGLEDIRANQNSMIGIRGRVEANQGLAIGSLANFQASDNVIGVDFGVQGQMAIGLVGAAAPFRSLVADLPWVEPGLTPGPLTSQGPSLATNNMFFGCGISVRGTNDTMGGFVDLHVTDNGSHGLHANVISQAGGAMGHFGRIVADRNNGNGIQADLRGTHAYLNAGYINANDNADTGMLLRSSATNGTGHARVFVTLVQAFGNATEDLFLQAHTRAPGIPQAIIDMDTSQFHTATILETQEP